MGVFEYVRRWVEDADIIIDFQKKQVKFENEKKLLNGWGFALDMTTCALFLSISVIVSFAFQWEFLPMLFSAAVMGVAWLCLINLNVLVMNLGPLRSLYFKTKRHPISRVTIRNPEGIIKYETRSPSPFFDLEFPKSVGRQLQTVSLLKNSGKTKLLKVEILGRAIGELVIKEF